MSVKQVQDDLIDSVHLLVPKFWLLRWDVGPFVVGHAILFHFLYHADIYHQNFHTQQNIYLQSFDSVELQCALVGIPLLLTLQMVVFLISQWSTHLRVSLGHNRVNHIDLASSVHVVAANNVGKCSFLILVLTTPCDSNRTNKTASLLTPQPPPLLVDPLLTSPYDRQRQDCRHEHDPHSTLLER